MGALLGADELPAVEVREGQGPFVFVCEHASNVLPRSLGTLGLSAADLDRHIAWDPGAAAIAAGLVARLGGDLVLQRYSRLAVDCNRHFDLPDAVAETSEDTVIPGNAGLTAEARAARIASVWQPFHGALEALVAARSKAMRPTVLATVHTFTPRYRNADRPWHVGIISTGDRRVADAMLAKLRAEKGLVVGDNEPYSAKDNVDYTIRRHGLDRRLPHVMIEVRNDLVADARGQEEWIARLARALSSFDVAKRAA
jgi:predicted N-formylglutamate amidohydrolase